MTRGRRRARCGCTAGADADRARSPAGVRAGRSGPALLLLHGSVAITHLVIPSIERLAGGSRCSAPDLLGQGVGQTRADYSLGGYRQRNARPVGNVSMDRVTVVGHSFGGGIAMQFAYQFPQYTERLVLHCAGCGWAGGNRYCAA